MTRMNTPVFSYPSVKQLVICGDIHGDFKSTVYRLCVQYRLTDTLLIVAGDCGFGFEKPGFYETVYRQVEGRLRKANNFIVFVRGNHDDPSYFSGEKIAFKRWRCVPDYSVVEACGHSILCVGGAVSVDRLPRMEENARRREIRSSFNPLWWEDEAPVFDYDAIAFLPKDTRIDTVVSHTCPSFCWPEEKRELQSWAVLDPALIDDVEKERQTMDEVFNALVSTGHPLERWYYGHYHRSWTGRREDVLFSMLDEGEFKEIPLLD